ncbi:MAG: hypothetical protein AAF552_05555 [Pseudomonadota bacterium]
MFKAVNTQEGASTAVVVVHGVGNPEPGATLDRLTASLANTCEAFRLDGPRQTWQAADQRRSDNDLYSFSPVPWQMAEHDGEKVVMAEVYWGSESAIPHSVLGLLQGLFQLIFGMSGLIEARPEGIGRYEWFVAWIGMIGSRLLRGPVFAINTALMFALLGIVLQQGVSHSESELLISLNEATPREVQLGVVGASIACALLGVFLGWRWVKAQATRVVSPQGTTGVYALSLLAVAGIWPAAAALQGAHDLEAFATIPFTLLWHTFGFVALAVLLVVNLYLGSRLVRPAFSNAERHSLSARAMALAIQFVLWSTIVPSIWLLTLSLVTSDSESFAFWLARFHEVVASDGLQWFYLPLPLLALVWVLLWRWKQRAGNPPRLIVHALIRDALLVSVVFTVIASVVVSVMNLEQAVVLPEIVQRLRRLEVALLPVIPLLVASSVFVGGVVLALDIGNDVVNYVRLAMPLKSRLKPSEDERERLRPIRNKFNEVMRLLNRHHPLERIIVVSHSQGTVLAIDELARSNFGQPPEWLEQLDVTLITMGSPFSHLYQHFFPLSYPALDQPVWRRLGQRLNRWINIYRNDDFVGTWIDAGSQPPFDFEQHAMGTGGHLTYLVDGRVVAIVADALERGGHRVDHRPS